MRHREDAERGRGDYGAPFTGSHPPIDLQEAVRYHNAGHLEKADWIYQNLLRQNPRDGEVLHLVGLLAIQRGDYPAAERMMRAAVAARPLNAGCWRDFGWSLHAQAKFHDAVGAYKNSVALRPRMPKAWLLMAQALSASKAFDQAVAACRQCLILTPNDLVALCDLATALKNLGRYEEAIRTLYRTLEIDPDFAAAREALCAVRVEAQWRRAWETWQRGGADVKKATPSTEGQRIGSACQVRDALSPTQCANLVRHILSRPAMRAGDGMKVRNGAAGVFQSDAHSVELNTDTAVIYDRLIKLILTINHVHYGLKIDRLDVFQVGEAGPQRKPTTDWHIERDGAENGEHEKGGRQSLMIAVQLSDPRTYDGGAVEFRIGRTMVPTDRKQGVAVIFPASERFRVAPVTRGRRYLLLCRCIGESG